MPLNKLFKKYSKLEASFDNTWLGKNPSLAYLIAVGAGPWKIARRKLIQDKAIDWYLNQKIPDLGYAQKCDIYPLSWQNNFIYRMTRYCQNKPSLFSNLCLSWKQASYQDALKELFVAAGCKNPEGSKVLWLFARDFLEIPAFPIDRHIKKFLISNNLPISSWEMVKICIDNAVSPNDFNRKLFPAGNPKHNLIKHIE